LLKKIKEMGINPEFAYFYKDYDDIELIIPEYYVEPEER
jgi:hypothetical protein